jgi:hypothetical protein
LHIADANRIMQELLAKIAQLLAFPLVHPVD